MTPRTLTRQRVLLTFRKCESLKNSDTSDIWIESGLRQADTCSSDSHFFSSMNDMNEFISRGPLYCRNSPLITWKIVGSAVTKNLPLRPGDDVTSTFAVLMFKSSDHVERSSQIGARLLHAGHHGA